MLNTSKTAGITARCNKHLFRCRLLKSRMNSPPECQSRGRSRSNASYTYDHHASAISVLPTNVDTSSAEYKQNHINVQAAIESIRSLHRKIEAGGSQKARDKHIARGKMLPREYANEMYIDVMALSY